MKKCDISLNSCRYSRSKQVAKPIEKQRIYKPKSPSVDRKIDRIVEVPRTPHNTSEFIMDQHEVKLFDPEELLGNTLGINLETNLY